MAVLTPLSPDDARRLSEQYDLGNYEGHTGIAAGSVNSNYALLLGHGRFFLRIYEEQARGGAEAEAARLVTLAARGVPTPPPIPRRDGSFCGEIAGKPAVLFPWRDGRMRCQASVTPEDMRAIGAALARVHRAGAGFEVPPNRFGAEGLRARLDRIAEDAEFSSLAPRICHQLDQALANRDPLLPRGFVHSDLFRDNVLWSPTGDIAALLDFESACDAPFAYDLMVTMLAWSFGDAFEPTLARALIQGYEAVRPLAAREKDGLYAEAVFGALRFLITRITDYAMRREVAGPRVVKDWRRFERRLDALEEMGKAGLLRMLF